MNQDFWIKDGKPALLLAPMEGVTDGPMRSFFSETQAFTHLVTEFLRVNDSLYGDHVFRRHAPESSNEFRTRYGTPVILQLLGGDAQRLAENAEAGVKCGARAIDLNFGCPAPTVNRHDGGATLLKYPDRLKNIVRTVRDAIPAHIPVSAKMRLGWDNINDVDRNFDALIEGGVSSVTIHGRTKIQGYKPPAYWEPIGRIRARSPIPIIANGEIWTFEDFLRCQDQTGCTHYMLGRGALADPGLPVRVARALGIESVASVPKAQLFEDTYNSLDASAWVPLIEKFSRESAKIFPSEDYTVRRVKQWINLSRFGRKFPWFDQIKTELSVECILNRMVAM
ncbi:MAG: tRNA-dihydrouridine synthase family protein [Xanthomonadaceae bacterium]|nr:tRNA-dihydrouridine synthase family protein [Xanthomonadaceae bacterium]